MITREEAWELLTEFNKEHFHLKHAVTVEGVMRYFARELGCADEEDFWGGGRDVCTISILKNIPICTALRSRR